MLRVLQSIFGGDSQKSRYSDDLVKDAIERTVDGTDPSIRGVLGYKKKLRSAVLSALDYVEDLIDGLSPPIEVASLSRNSDPRLKNFFVSSRQMQNIFLRDPELSAFMQGRGREAKTVTVLLVMEKDEKSVLGAARSGEMIMRDVPQVSVSFSNHVLRDPAQSEEETRRLLKKRAFDHLLGLALNRISAVKEQCSSLERRRALLQAKINVRQREQKTEELADLQAQYDQIEPQMKALGGDACVCESHLKIVTDVLSQPKKWLFSEKMGLIVDAMGIKCSEEKAGAQKLELGQICNAEGREVTVTLLSLSCEALRENLSHGASS